MQQTEISDTGADSISLLYPLNGDIYVDPNTEIMVRGPKEDTWIRVDGELAVSRNEIVAPFYLIDCSDIGPYRVFRIRRKSGLPNRDVLVQAWTPSTRSIEQRFFVKGINVPALPIKPPPRLDENRVAVGDLSFFVRDEWVNGENYSLHVRDRDYVLVSWFRNHFYIIKPNYLRKINRSIQSAFVDGEYIHIKTGNTSYHMPIDYNGDHWSSFYHKGVWDMIFDSRMHIWWNKKKMIVKHDPNPLAQTSYDVVWTQRDLRQDSIESIHIIDEERILVNKKRVINSRFPKVYE